MKAERGEERMKNLVDVGAKEVIKSNLNMHRPCTRLCVMHDGGEDHLHVVVFCQMTSILITLTARPSWDVS